MPTLRQNLAIQKVSDFIRNPKGNSLNLGKILRECGYADSVCKKPHLVTESPGFQKALNNSLRNLDLQVKFQHLSLINQSENLSVKAKAIDMYYKLTGKYKTGDITSERDEEISKALDIMASLVK